MLSIVFGDKRPELLQQECLYDIFCNTATKQPNAIALIFGTKKLTYKEFI